MITIDDIIKRSRYINYSNESDEYTRYHNKTKLLLESNVDRFNDTKFILHHWQSLDENQIECFKKVVDLLEDAYEKDNANSFNYIKSYIINEVTPTVRDAKQSMRYLKYKTTRMKNKIAGNIKKNVEDIKSATTQTVNKVKETDKQTIDTVKNNVKKGLGQKDIQEAYVEIQYALDKYNHCDRVLENTNTIQKRFNIMNMVENTDIMDDIKLEILVDTICECINTYDADYSTRFNSVLETCFYFLGRTRKPYNKSLVLEQTVNNFIGRDYTDEDLLGIKSIIEFSPIIDAVDKKNVEYIYNTIPYDENVDYTKSLVITNEDPIQIEMVQSTFVMDFGIYNEISDSTKNTVKDIINSFKLAKHKRDIDPRTCVSKMFTKSADQIIDGTPNFFSWLRLSYVIGATAINPILGAVTLLVDQFISMKLKRRDVSKMITVFKNEQKAVAEKMKKADDKEKRNLKEYDRYLKDGLEKLQEYENSLLADSELYSTDTEDDDNDFTFDDIELEATSFETLFEKSNFFSSDYFTSNISRKISLMNEDTIDIITDIACKYPNIINTNKLYTILKEELDDTNTYSDTKNWVRISCLNSNMRKVHPENGIIATDDDMSDVFEIITGLEDLFVEYSISKTIGITNESASTNIKMLSNKLQKALQKASDIDKEASRRIDSSVNMFLSGMQRAARNNNREAIIRGSILPSASKVIKAALLDTTAALLNPALGIILAVGQFAVSKKMKVKERQLVLDEIDIELEMCKRYLRQAEDQNDLEAQKKILKIQRNLERQKQRIEYNMKIHWNQDVPNTASKEDY